MLTLKWLTCGDDQHWCSFEKLNLSSIPDGTTGVYVIWHGGDPGRIVYVGQGDIADRLADHRSNQEILAYKKDGPLMVTWASVSVAQLDGVERYLADRWNPLVGDVWPDVAPIAVSSPW